MDLFHFIVVPLCAVLAFQLFILVARRFVGSVPEAAYEWLFAVAQVALLLFSGFFNLVNLGVFISLFTCVFLGISGKRFVAVLALLMYCVVWIDVRYIEPGFSGSLAQYLNSAVKLLVDPNYIIGTSYLAFKLISVYVDREVLRQRSPTFVSFFNWMFFFPAIVSGPIHLFDDWCDKRQRKSISIATISESAQRILSGVFKNVVASQVIADLSASRFTDGAISFLSYGEIFAGMFFYTIYIYLNFSGFSDIAIGSGLLWGVRLPENFNLPFFKRNLQEFWMAWHMSLLNWLRRYLFIPLLFTLSKMPMLSLISRDLPTIVSLWILFLAVALWHAWTINYLFWGVSNALALSLLHILKSRLNWKRPLLKKWRESRICYGISCATTFFFTVVTFGPLALSTDQFTLLIERVAISSGVITCEKPEGYLQGREGEVVAGHDARCVFYQYRPTIVSSHQ